MGISTEHIELEHGGRIEIPHRQGHSYYTGMDDRIGEEYTEIRIPRSEKVATKRIMQDEVFNEVVNVISHVHDWPPEKVIRELAGEKVKVPNDRLGVNPRFENRMEMAKLQKSRENTREKESKSYAQRFKELFT